MNCDQCKYKNEQTIKKFCNYEENRRNKDNDILPSCFCLDGRYLLKYKTSGGYSNIYIAYDTHKNILVIIKEFFESSLIEGRDKTGYLLPYESADDEQRHDKLQRYSNKIKDLINESKRLSLLNNIAILPQFYNFFSPNEYNAFMIMEYIEGEHIDNVDMRSSKEILKLFKPFIKGLIDIHKQQIIHRDINPNNIIVHNNTLKLIDFGLADEIIHAGTKSVIKETTYRTRGDNKPDEIYDETKPEDSRTDTQEVAKLILSVYDERNIRIPDNVGAILSKALEPIEQRINMYALYQELYGVKEQNIQITKKVAVTSTIMFAIAILVFAYKCSNNMVLKPNVEESSSISQIVDKLTTLTTLKSLKEPSIEERLDTADININNVDVDVDSIAFKKEDLIALIEEASGYILQERYLAYADYDNNGKNEIFVLIPTKIVEESYDGYVIDNWDGEYEWIDSGEIWFSDGLTTAKVDEVNIDDWQGGGNYEVLLLQFGNTYHVQFHKFYGIMTRSQGPVNIYTYNSGIPFRTHKGYINNSPFYDSGPDLGVYYTIHADKAATGLHGRTFDKVYVYYRDGMYYSYKSEQISIDSLYVYDNFDNVLLEGIREILLNYDSEHEWNIIPSIDYINDQQIYVFECSADGLNQYITLFDAYVNESGRIYLNTTIWSEKEHYRASGIWEQQWPVDGSFEREEGWNNYIVYRIKKSTLEIEDVLRGFWEKHDDLSSGGKLEAGWRKAAANTLTYINEYGVELRYWQFIDEHWYYFNMDGVMLIGWQGIDGFVYYFFDSGEMALGWVYIDSNWYYFGYDGKMQEMNKSD